MAKYDDADSKFHAEAKRKAEARIQAEKKGAK
jgi:hypothetical protein